MSLLAETNARTAPFQDASQVRRDKAFRAAKRHSAMVRTLRWCLPVLAAIIGSLYVIPSQFSVEIAGQQATVEALDVTSGGLKMVNPRIKGRHPTQGSYDVRALSALQNAANPDLITLERIDADLIAKSGEKTTMVAASGLYDSKAEQMTFNEGVDIERSSGLKAKLKSAVAYFSKNLVVSKEPVEVRLHESVIRAQSLEIFTNEARAVFTGNVYVHIQRQPETGGGAKPVQ